MKKIDFLNELYAYLSPLTKNERKEVLEDFRAHFREGTAEGKTEEQICAELGTPYECAKHYVGDALYEIKKRERKKQIFWSGAFIVNIIISFITLPATLFFFLVGSLMCVFFAFTVPLIGSTAFLIFAISSTGAVFILGTLNLLETVDEFRKIIRKINK